MLLSTDYNWDKDSRHMEQSKTVPNFDAAKDFQRLTLLRSESSSIAKLI